VIGTDSLVLLSSLPEGCHKIYLSDSTYLEVYNFDPWNYFSWGTYCIDEEKCTMTFQQSFLMADDFWTIKPEDYFSTDLYQLIMVDRKSFVQAYNNDFVSGVFQKSISQSIGFDTVNYIFFKNRLVLNEGKNYGELPRSFVDSGLVNTSGIIETVSHSENRFFIIIHCGAGLLAFVMLQNEQLHKGEFLNRKRLNQLLKRSEGPVFFESRVN